MLMFGGCITVQFFLNSVIYLKLVFFDVCRFWLFFFKWGSICFFSDPDVFFWIYMYPDKRFLRVAGLYKPVWGSLLAKNNFHPQLNILLVHNFYFVFWFVIEFILLDELIYVQSLFWKGEHISTFYSLGNLIYKCTSRIYICIDRLMIFHHVLGTFCGEQIS